MIILNGANIDCNLRLSDQTPNRLVIVNASLDVVSGNGVIASDNLRASVMGTTGSGSLVFANSPVFGGIVQMAGFQLGTSATPGHVLTANASGVGTYQAIVALPAGTSGQTLRHDGTGWVANSNIFNNGTNVGIGTTAPTQRLDVEGQIRIRGGSPAAGRFLGGDVNGVGTWQLIDIDASTTGSLRTTRLIEPESMMMATPLTARPLFDVLRADRTAFLPAEQIIIEASTDAGLTWFDAGVSDTNKMRLFTGQRPAINIPTINGIKNTNCMLRVTITGMRYNVPPGTPETERYNFWNSANVLSTERYCTLNEGWMWVNSFVDRIHCTVMRATANDSNNWVLDREAFMNGWTHGNYIRLSGGVFGGAGNLDSNWRFVFRTATANLNFNNAELNTTWAAGNQTIIQIKTSGQNSWIHSNNLSVHDRIYSYDELQNTTFPARVTATQLFEGVSRVFSPNNLNIGGGAVNYVAGNDTKLFNARNPLPHNLIDLTNHIVSGLTVGHVIKATAANAYAFGALIQSDIPNLSPAKIIQDVNNRFVSDFHTSNWNTAHSWGNHAGLYSSILHTHGHISNIGAITSTPVIPASGDCLLLTDATDGNSIRRSVPLGTGTNTFLRNDGAWAVPGGSGAAGSSDLVYSQAVNTNVQINSTTPQAVLSAPLENIAAGDIIEVEINGNILNNSGAVRTFIHSFTLGATTFDYTDGTTIAASASALATHNIRFRFAVIATNNIFFDGYVSRGEPNVAGTRQAIAATTVGHIFNTSANNETGNKNVVYLCRGQNATPTQTFQLRSYKVSVIKAKVMAVIPVTPTGLVVREDNILRALAAWNAVNNATSYPIQVRVNGGAATDAVAFNTWWESDAFTAGNLVEVRVAARNAAGTSTYSAWVGVTVTGIPKTPTDIRIVDLGNYAQVSWNSSQGATSYMVEHRVNDGTHMFTETIDTSWGSTWHNANDIVHARVAARNANGTSAYSGWVSVTLSGM